jgi:hypothetical protein
MACLRVFSPLWANFTKSQLQSGEDYQKYTKNELDNLKLRVLPGERTGKKVF